MLKTYETKPQVKVNVNYMPAVCHNMTCDYTYVDPVGTIDSFTYHTANKSLNVTGTKLPNMTDVESITFAQAFCNVTDNTTVIKTNVSETITNADNTTTTVTTEYVTAFACVLNRTETAGNWHP